MADSNKIKYGLKSVHYAVATIAADNTATYDTPVAINGAVNLSLDPQGETSPFYADNIAYYTAVSNNGYEGDLEIAKVPESFKKDVLGFKEDANGVLYEDANAPVVHFALMFQFEGDVNATRFVMFNCVAARPTVAGATKEDAIEPQTETLELTISSINVNGEDVVQAYATAGSTAYNGWFSDVYEITAGT